MMNEDLGTIDDWLLRDSLTINVKKTEYIVFDSGKATGSSQVAFWDVILRKVDKNAYLGLIIDAALSFSDHANRLQRNMTAYSFLSQRLRYVIFVRFKLKIKRNKYQN
jgi:hypothetical protein